MLREFFLIVCVTTKKGSQLYFSSCHLKASFSSRLQIRLDVPWIQVSNAHQKTWSSERPEFTEAEHLSRETALSILNKIKMSFASQTKLINANG